MGIDQHDFTIFIYEVDIAVKRTIIGHILAFTG